MNAFHVKQEGFFPPLVGKRMKVLEGGSTYNKSYAGVVEVNEGMEKRQFRREEVKMYFTDLRKPYRHAREERLKQSNNETS